MTTFNPELTWIESEFGFNIATINKNYACLSQSEANAKLIAEAPETKKQRDKLLNACMSAMEEANRIGNDYSHKVATKLQSAIKNATEK